MHLWRFGVILEKKVIKIIINLIGCPGVGEFQEARLELWTAPSHISQEDNKLPVSRTEAQNSLEGTLFVFLYSRNSITS